MNKENNLEEHKEKIEFINAKTKEIIDSVPLNEYFNIILLSIATSLVEIAIRAYIDLEDKEEDSIRKLIAENFYNCIMKKQPTNTTGNIFDLTNIIN